MRKYLLVTLALAGTLIAGAGTAERHPGMRSQTGLKEINCFDR